MLSLIEFRTAQLAQRYPAGVGSRFFAATDEGATYFDTGFAWWKIAGPDQATITATEYIPPYSFVGRDGKRATSANASAILGFTITGGIPTKPMAVYLNGQFTNPDWQWTPGQALYLNGATLASTGKVRVGTATGAQSILVRIEPTQIDLNRIGVLGGQVGILGGNVAYYN